MVARTSGWQDGTQAAAEVVARLSYSQRALDDLARLTDFLLATDPAAAVQTAEVIEEAVNILRRHPLIGRPAEAGLRELLISLYPDVERDG